MRKHSRSSLNRRDLLIVDTGTIRELVTFHAVENLGFDKLRNHLRFFFTREAHVAELNYWIRKTDLDGHVKLWNRVHDEFRNMKMDEEVVKLVNMDMILVVKHGPVDTSILDIAKRNSGVSPFVLTIDDKLVAECKRALIAASSLNEIIYSAIGQ